MSLFVLRIKKVDGMMGEPAFYDGTTLTCGVDLAEARVFGDDDVTEFLADEKNAEWFDANTEDRTFIQLPESVVMAEGGSS